MTLCCRGSSLWEDLKAVPYSLNILPMIGLESVFSGSVVCSELEQLEKIGSFCKKVGMVDVNSIITLLQALSYPLTFSE